MVPFFIALISIKVVSQGPIVGYKLTDYVNRHPDIENRLSKNRPTRYFTPENNQIFDQKASQFLDQEIRSEHVEIN